MDVTGAHDCVADTFEVYMDALGAVDYDAALEALQQALSGGVPWARLVDDVVAPAQRRVGELWMTGSFGVADEHAATAVAEDVLAVVSPPTRPEEPTARVVMVCGEGEWHSFPLRLAATVAARSADLHLTVLGGSISGDHLRQYVRRNRPAAVALSVTMPVHLVGTARSIRASLEEGVPVVVGGGAWGGSQDRARRLGASCLVDDPADLAAVVGSLGAPPTVADVPTVPEEAFLLESPPRELLQLAHRRQAAASPSLGDGPSPRQDTLEELAWLARHAASAVACDDSTIVGEQLQWLVQLLAPREVPAMRVLDSALHLADAVEPVAPAGAAMLRVESLAARRRLLESGAVAAR